LWLNNELFRAKIQTSSDSHSQRIKNNQTSQKYLTSLLASMAPKYQLLLTEMHSIISAENQNQSEIALKNAK
jgi:hypothetical protein